MHGMQLQAFCTSTVTAWLCMFYALLFARHCQQAVMSELLSWVYELVKLPVAACRICNLICEQPQHTAMMACALHRRNMAAQKERQWSTPLLARQFCLL